MALQALLFTLQIHMNMKVVGNSQFLQSLNEHIGEARKPKIDIRFEWERDPAPIGVLDAIMRTWTHQVQARKRNFLADDAKGNSNTSVKKEISNASNINHQSHSKTQIERSIQYINQTVSPYLKRNNYNDEIPGGHVVVDVDEAVHGSYAGIKDVNQIAKEGPEAVAREYRLEALEWQTEPFKAIQHSVIPNGIGDFAVNAAVGLPLSYLALKATMEGVESLQESREYAQVLKKRKQEINSTLKKLSVAKAAMDDSKISALQAIKPLLANVIAHDSQQLQDVQFAKTQNKLSGQIGLGSCVSGVSIMAKVATTVGMQTGFSIAGGGVNGAAPFVAQSVAAGVAATVAGTTSTMVLAPLAAAGAIGLGAVFTKKSSAQRKEFLRRFEPTKKHVELQNEIAKLKLHKCWETTSKD